jgi:hypothetical protein
MEEVSFVYPGTYKRLLIPPVIVMGLGRFGSRVCDEFFTELDATLRPTARGDAPAGVPRVLQDLIGRVAIVRHMDTERLPLDWAGEHRFCWDAVLDQDDENQSRYDLDLDLNSNLFWRVPLSEFQRHAPDLLARIGEDCSQLMNGVSNLSWATGRELLGLPPVGNLNVVRRWVIAVGSLCEPDVAALAPLLRAWSVNELVQGAEALCANLTFLDCGLPDHPAKINQSWQQCPGPLVDQLLSNIRSVESKTSNISWFLTGSRVDGIDSQESVRRQVIAGLLKTYITSLLFHPRRTEAARQSTFLQGLGGDASMSSRAGVYVEATLAMDNLDELVAHEVLAEWKRRVAAAAVITLDSIQSQLADQAGQSPQDFLLPLVTFCCRAAIDHHTPSAVEALQSFLENERNSAADELAAEKCRGAVADASPIQKPGWLDRIFKRHTERPPSPSLPSATSRLETVIERYTILLGYVGRILPLVQEVVRPEGAFQDRVYDHHFEVSQNMNKLYVRYRRIPLDACPPRIREWVESVVSQVDGILLQGLLKGDPTASIVTLLTSELKKRWGQRKTTEAEEIWGMQGIAPWLNADPSLQRRIAEFAYSRLAPLWQFFPLRSSNWKGYLTVLDFGGRQPSGLPHESTASAIDRLVVALKAASESTDPLGTLDQQWRLRAALNQSNIYFEAWPFYRSIGLLWTEYPVDGYGFGSDCDATQLEMRVDRWKTEQVAQTESTRSPSRSSD